LVDREVLDRRLARVEELLTRLRQLAGVPREEYLREAGLQAQAERWLQLCAESVLDLAAHVIADSGLRTPTTYRESFQILREAGVLEEALAKQMERWAGLRNVLVHLYLDVDQDILFDILQDDLGQVQAFVQAVVRFVGE
jgi:uncharacterized protein YutE (UPF0331/DUF86 family)